MKKQTDYETVLIWCRNCDPEIKNAQLTTAEVTHEGALVVEIDLDEELEKCEKCNQSVVAWPLDDPPPPLAETGADYFITAADMELENGNWHSLSASTLFDCICFSIKPQGVVEPRLRTDIARGIYRYCKRL